MPAYLTFSDLDSQIILSAFIILFAVVMVFSKNIVASIISFVAMALNVCGFFIIGQGQFLAAIIGIVYASMASVLIILNLVKRDRSKGKKYGHVIFLLMLNFICLSISQNVSEDLAENSTAIDQPYFVLTILTLMMSVITSINIIRSID